MTEAALHDRRGLPGELIMWVLIVSELAVFGAALLIFLVLRGRESDGIANAHGEEGHQTRAEDQKLADDQHPHHQVARQPGTLRRVVRRVSGQDVGRALLPSAHAPTSSR